MVCGQSHDIQLAGSLQQIEECNFIFCAGCFYPKTWRDCKRLPPVHLIGCQVVKLFLPNNFLSEMYEFCHNLSVWALSQFEFLSSVTFWVFEFYNNMSVLVLSHFEFCNDTNFWIFIKIFSHPNLFNIFFFSFNLANFVIAKNSIPKFCYPPPKIF